MLHPLPTSRFAPPISSAFRPSGEGVGRAGQRARPVAWGLWHEALDIPQLSSMRRDSESVFFRDPPSDMITDVVASEGRPIRQASFRGSRRVWALFDAGGVLLRPLTSSPHLVDGSPLVRAFALLETQREASRSSGA